MASSWRDSWGQSWAGAWGPLVEVPGAMRGSAHGTSTALGIITIANLPVPEIDYGGGVTPPRTDDPQRRRRRDDETLLMIGAL